MKKGLFIIIVFIIVLGIAGCGNDPAEENEVMSYLLNNRWYKYSGKLMDIEEFHKDGTYTFSEEMGGVVIVTVDGKYEIDTNNDSIKMKPEGSSEYNMTYSLYNDGMKLFSNTGEYYVLEYAVAPALEY